MTLNDAKDVKDAKFSVIMGRFVLPYNYGQLGPLRRNDMHELKNSRIRREDYPDNDCWVSLQKMEDKEKYIVLRTWHHTASPLIHEPVSDYNLAEETYNRQRDHAFEHAKTLFGEDKVSLLEFSGSSTEHAVRKGEMQ